MAKIEKFYNLNIFFSIIILNINDYVTKIVLYQDFIHKKLVK
jgi:hypothetical protein